MSEPGDTGRKNRILLLKLLVVVAAMFAFAVFVMPPIYNVFCQLTGLNGKTNKVAVAGPTGSPEMDRPVRVEFITATDPQLPWDFHQNQPALTTHPGEIAQTTFHVRNRADHAITGHAVPSISPVEAAAFFRKTQCFCFSSQTLKAGESRDMPVIFYIEPGLPRTVNEITLSYTFYKEPDPAPGTTASP